MNGTHLPCLTSVLSPQPWQTSSPPGQPFGTLVILSWYPSLVRPQFAIQFSRNTQPALTPPPAPLPAPISPNTPSIPLGFHTPNLPPLYKCSVWNGGEKMDKKKGRKQTYRFIWKAHSNTRMSADFSTSLVETKEQRINNFWNWPKRLCFRSP